jgi:DNA-binding transcriptional MerR regulator
MNIGQLASQAGVSIDTIRFWERRGVLPAAPRAASGYRVYTESTLARIRHTRRLQNLGLSLDEIIGALHAHDQGHASCDTQRWRLEAALDRIEVRIDELARLRADVREALADCDAGTCQLAVPSELAATLRTDSGS